MTMSWYVLFVKTGDENRSVYEVNKVWQIDGIRPFIPMFDAKFRNSGKVFLEKRRLFPGYVFIETEMSGIEFYMTIRRLVVRSDHMLKILRYGNMDSDCSFVMKEEERQAFLKLCNNDRCVEISQGFIEGDQIVITDGPLFGFESLIKRINRHKMEATLEVELMGDKREVIVGLEVVKKVANPMVFI